MRQATLLIVALVLAAGAVGCGSSSNRLTRTEFRTEANAVCTKYDAKLKTLPRPKGLSDVDTYVSRALPLFTSEIAEIRALKPPADLQDQVDRMLARAQDTVTAAKKLRDAAKKGDQLAAQTALREGQAASNDANKIARGLGLTRCAT
jgi:hypothetical protein